MAIKAAEGDWKVENDLRTLVEADYIKRDPKRYKAAMDLAKDKQMALKGLRDDAEEEMAEAEDK